MNEQIKLQAEALFEVLQPTATAQEREIGVEQLTYILDLAYSDLTNPEMVDLVETARAILMAKQKVVVIVLLLLFLVFSILLRLYCVSQSFRSRPRATFSSTLDSLCSKLRLSRL